jgi:hypothetical protein
MLRQRRIQTKVAKIASGSIAHDPREQLTGIMLTRRMMDSPQPPCAFVDFRTSAYRAIDD